MDQHPGGYIGEALAAAREAQENPMRSHAYLEGFAYRVQVVDANHGLPVLTAGAQSQREAITIANGWRENPANTGRIVEIVRQSKTRQGDPIRFRYNAQAAEWQAVSWNTDDATPRREKARKVGTV